MEHIILLINNRVRNICFLAVISIVIFSPGCAPPKQSLIYFQEPSNSREAFITRPAPPTYKIRINDLLFVQVTTPDFENRQFLEISSSKTNIAGGDQAAYLASYPVTDSGEVALPHVGRIKVQGLSLTEAGKTIEVAVKQFVRNADVSVKLASFSVSVLGEVRHPGRFPVLAGQINLFEALAMAGDLTENADRKNVRVIREASNGSFFYTLDLTDRNLLASEKLYLQPNDLVYVELVKPRPDQAEVTKAQLAFSLVSALAFLGNIIVVIFRR